MSLVPQIMQNQATPPIRVLIIYKGYTNTKDHGSTYDSANTVYNQISGELGSGKNLYDLPDSKRYSVEII